MSGHRGIPETWRRSALHPVTRLSEGYCPYHCIPLIHTYCSLCDAKWELRTCYPTDVLIWTIVFTQGKHKQCLSGGQQHLIPPPYPG